MRRGGKKKTPGKLVGGTILRKTSSDRKLMNKHRLGEDGRSKWTERQTKSKKIWNL